MNIQTAIKSFLMTSALLFFVACGDSEESAAPQTKYDLSYKGLSFYYQNKSSSAYRLSQLSNSEFNALSEMQQLQVADKLLSSLFFAYPQAVLE